MTNKIVMKLLEDVAKKFEKDQQLDPAFVRGYQAAVRHYRDFIDFADRLDGTTEKGEDQ